MATCSGGGGEVLAPAFDGGAMVVALALHTSPRLCDGAPDHRDKPVYLLRARADQAEAVIHVKGDANTTTGWGRREGS